MTLWQCSNINIFLNNRFIPYNLIFVFPYSYPTSRPWSYRLYCVIQNKLQHNNITKWKTPCFLLRPRESNVWHTHTYICIYWMKGGKAYTYTNVYVGRKYYLAIKFKGEWKSKTILPRRSNEALKGIQMVIRKRARTWMTKTILSARKV